MRTIRALVIATVALGLSSSLGCKPSPPDGTNPPDDGDAAAAEDGGKKGKKDKKGKKGKDGDTAKAEPEMAKECEGKEGPTPSTFFGENVMLRQPEGIEMTEGLRTPFLAELAGTKYSPTCMGDVEVSRFFLGYFADDPAVEIKAQRDGIVEQIGFDPTKLTWTDEKTDGRNYWGTFEAAAGEDGSPPVKSLFMIRHNVDTLYWMDMEAHPNAYPAIMNTYKKVADSFLFLNPGGSP